MNIEVSLRNAVKLGSFVLAALACLGTGYYLGSQREESGSSLAPGTGPPLDYYFSQPSFSEVEDAKATLDGLCQRFRTEISARRVADQQSRDAASGLEPGSEPHIKNAITELERGMHEFAGTSQQLDVAQDLLQALKKGKQFDHWVDVYLAALYEQPTHPVVARLANEAVLVAKLCGREREVITGLTHVEEIPGDFAGKSQVQAALNSARGRLAANGLRTLEESHQNSFSPKPCDDPKL
jgi:hypothetical protein